MSFNKSSESEPRPQMPEELRQRSAVVARSVEYAQFVGLNNHGVRPTQFAVETAQNHYSQPEVQAERFAPVVDMQPEKTPHAQNPLFVTPEQSNQAYIEALAAVDGAYNHDQKAA